MEGVCGAIF